MTSDSAAYTDRADGTHGGARVRGAPDVDDRRERGRAPADRSDRGTRERRTEWGDARRVERPRDGRGTYPRDGDADHSGQRTRRSSIPRLHLDEIGHSLLAWHGRGRGSERKVARRLPEEAGRIAVVMGHPDGDLMPQLAERLAPYVPFGWDSVRLVSARAAVANGDGVPPAQILADLLSVEVLAPDGRLISGPDGSVFVGRERDRPDTGLWWRFRPGRPPESTGRRFPVPEWEPELATFRDPNIPGLVVDELPAGLWARAPGRRRTTDLAYAVAAHPGRMALVVSRAGDRPLRTADLTRLIAELPEGLQDRLTVIPYGDEPVAEARLGAVASLAANRTLRVRTGMPLYVRGGGTRVVAVGADGRPTWHPFARELAWRPHGGPRILSWFIPADNLLPAGQAQLLLNEKWLVEVIEAGLWVREVDRLDGAAIVRQLPLSSTSCSVVVGVDGHSPYPPPWRSIVRLLRRLPRDARRRLRLVVPEAGGSRLLRGAKRACRRVIGRRRVCLLTSEGRLVRLYGAQRYRSVPLRDPHRRSYRLDDTARDSSRSTSRRYRSSPRSARRSEPTAARSLEEAWVLDGYGEARDRTGTRPPLSTVDDTSARTDRGGGPSRPVQRARPPGDVPIVRVPDLVLNEDRVGPAGIEPGFGHRPDAGPDGRKADDE